MGCRVWGDRRDRMVQVQALGTLPRWPAQAGAIPLRQQNYHDNGACHAMTPHSGPMALLQQDLSLRLASALSTECPAWPPCNVCFPLWDSTLCARNSPHFEWNRQDVLRREEVHARISTTMYYYCVIQGDSLDHDVRSYHNRPPIESSN